MADSVMTHGEGSPQNVAFKLLKELYGIESFKDRKTLLDAYAECLHAAHGGRDWSRTPR